MDQRKIRAYLWSVPERVVRSVTAIAAGTLRELGEFAIPRRLRRTRLYRTLVDSTLRFLIEQVGRVEGAYQTDDAAMKDFLVRRTAGNVLEVAGIVAFRASPVWVLAALADLSGAGRDLVADISETLQREGLLDPDRRFETVEQMLDGFERMSGRLAESVNAPPLDVAQLREEWARLKDEARTIPVSNLPGPGMLWNQWRATKAEAEKQGQSTWAVSSAMAVGALRRLPENARWLSRAAQVSSRHAGQMLARGLLDDYNATLSEIRETGFLTYWWREFRPYLAGALRQFSPAQVSLTERLLARRTGRMPRS